MEKEKKNKTESIKKFFKKIGGFFTQIGEAFTKGDIWVKCSLLVAGAGYLRRKQIVKGILVTLLEVGFVLYTALIGFPYLSKLGSLGEVERTMVYNPATMKNEVNDYDNSLLILLFGVISLATLLVGILLWLWNLVGVYRVQKLAENGKHVNSFREDMHAMFNQKFYITLLALPIAGIVIFNIMPLIVMVCVAFTNYDQNHMPPSALFTWVGFNNFKNLFASGGLTMTFGYSFRKILSWTIIWAIVATATTYLGGIVLAMMINSKYTKAKKMWRTLFVAAISIPQFVTLLLLRNFFANTGIANTLLAGAGVTDFLKTVGLITTDYIPFLTDPNWAKVTIIVINIWIGVPYLMLIATGVLMNIPEDIKESARIDGANGFQIFRKITMPYMLFVTGPYLVTQFVQNLNNFNVIYLLTQDIYVTTDQKMAASNGKEIDLLVTWLYRLTSEYYNYKMASVIGICVFVICALFTLVAFNFMIKGDKEERFQ